MGKFPASYIQKIFIFVSVFVVVFGAVRGIFYLLKSNKKLNVIQELKKQVALGKDAESIIKAAQKLQKNSNYQAVYDIIISDTLEATKPAKYKRVEKKLGSLERVDSFLADNTPATSFIQNSQGAFFCSYVEDLIPKCYDVTQKKKNAEQKSSEEFDMNIFKIWQQNKAIKTTIDLQKIQVSGEERICDQVNSLLIGSNLTSEMLGDITKLIPDKATPEDLSKSKQILDKLQISTSNCYDRESGLPIKTSRTIKMVDQKQDSVQTLSSFSSNPQFIKKITPKKIITSPSETFRRMSHLLIDGNTMYMAGEQGIYTIKDSKLIQHDKEIYHKAGRINALKQFQKKIYLGAARGLFSLIQGKWVLQMDILKTFNVSDFVVFENSLYMATGKGTFILQKDSWVQPSKSFKDMGGVSKFAIVNHKLHALTHKGVYLFSENEWKEILAMSSLINTKLFSDNNHLFIATSSATLEIKDKKPAMIATTKATGTVEDTVFFKNNIFIAGYKGIYSTDNKYILKEDEVGNARKFYIFQNRLYAGTEAGVYRLDDFGWSPMHDGTMGEIVTFFENNGVLYAGGLLGAYKFNGFGWNKSLAFDINKFYSVDGHLYITSNNESTLYELVEEQGDLQELFNLPVNAQVIKL